MFPQGTCSSTSYLPVIVLALAHSNIPLTCAISCRDVPVLDPPSRSTLGFSQNAMLVAYTRVLERVAWLWGYISTVPVWDGRSVSALSSVIPLAPALTAYDRPAF